MARTYKLDQETKGTGANVVPADSPVEPPADAGLNTVRLKPEPRRQRSLGEKTSTPLPPGHVRKKTTGEIGRVLSVDAKGGTASVAWLKQGRTSTVPLSAVTRH